jgi:hypothetical protein
VYIQYNCVYYCDTYVLVVFEGRTVDMVYGCDRVREARGAVLEGVIYRRF